MNLGSDSVRNVLDDDLETWRLIVLREDGSEFMVCITDSGLLLPTVQIPAHSRTAHSLNARLSALWNLQVYSLYPIQLKDTHGAMRYHVVEILNHDTKASLPGHWISVRDVCRTRFAEDSDFAAVHKWIDNLAAEGATASQTPFRKPGWFLSVKDFVQDAVRNIPLRLNGQFVQYNASSSFSLIRFDTDGDAAWFKAVGEPNTREFPLTVLLSSKLAPFLPQVLATHPAWNAWITRGIEGTPLSQTGDAASWCAAARDLARMQIASIEMKEELLRCQPRDVRTSALLARIKSFFALLADLMERQPKTVPPPLSTAELEQLERDTRDALFALEQEKMPDTLGHLDLNPENIFALRDGTVFLDWAEGSVGLPLFSLAHLSEHCQRALAPSDHVLDRLFEAYASEWERFASFKNFRKTLCLSMFAAIFAHAVSTDPWRDGANQMEPRIASYYRSLGRRMKSYSARWKTAAWEISGVIG
jgi:hypothetical protein